MRNETSDIQSLQSTNRRRPFISITGSVYWSDRPFRAHSFFLNTQNHQDQKKKKILKMVNYVLKITADLENLTNLQPSGGCDDPNFPYLFKVSSIFFDSLRFVSLLRLLVYMIDRSSA